jgi:hypothetical protein
LHRPLDRHGGQPSHGRWQDYAKLKTTILRSTDERLQATALQVLRRATCGAQHDA